MLRFTYDGHMYMCTHIYVSGQATMPLVWNLIKWLFLLWVLIYVCAISCSCFMQFSPFSHTIIPHLYIFTPIFIVSPNCLGLMLFVSNWCDKKYVYLVLSFLALSCLVLSYLILSYSKLACTCDEICPSWGHCLTPELMSCLSFWYILRSHECPFIGITFYSMIEF